MFKCSKQQHITHLCDLNAHEQTKAGRVYESRVSMDQNVLFLRLNLSRVLKVMMRKNKRTK